MSKLLFNTKYKENEYLQITASLVVSTGFGDDKFYEKVMVVASMYPAGIVVKPINCEYTSI